MSETSGSTMEPRPYDLEGSVAAGSEFEGAARSAAPRSLAYWLFVLLIIVLLSEEVAYAFNLVTPALPSMVTNFHTTQIAWVSTAFSLSGAIAAPLLGKLADMQGKKRWLLITAALMAVGSLTVALAPTFGVVIAGRAIEGLGLAIVPIAYSLMRDIFPKRMITFAVSVSVAGIGLTGVVGPIFAGYLIDNFGYRGVFWALALFPVLVGLLLLAFVPESPVRVRSAIDWIGAILLGAALALMLLAIGEGATRNNDTASSSLPPSMNRAAAILPSGPRTMRREPERPTCWAADLRTALNSVRRSLAPWLSKGWSSSSTRASPSETV